MTLPILITISAVIIGVTLCVLTLAVIAHYKHVNWNETLSMPWDEPERDDDRWQL